MLNDTLVISHGLNHQEIKEVNYNTSKFLDPNPGTDPDYIISADYKFITNIIKQKFDNIILAASPVALVLSSIIIGNLEIPVDGELNKNLYNNIRLLLNNNKILYSKSSFVIENDDEDHIDNDQLYIDKMYSLGFIFNGTFLFSIYRKPYLKFIKVNLPTKENCFDYLGEIIKIRSLLDKNLQVKMIYLKYYSYVYNKEVIQKTIINDDFDFDSLLPYKNLDEDDPDFIDEDEKYHPNDILKLKYIMFDETSVTLI